MTLDKSPLFLSFPATHISEPLQALQAQLALTGRRMLPAQFHLTLRFLGQPNATQYRSLLRQLPSMQLPAFSLQLDTLGYFSAANVVWLGPSIVPAALSNLYHDLTLRCGSLRMPPPHKAYRPHISLFRQATLAMPASLATITPITYRPRELCLYRSVPGPEGSEYQLEASWPLTHCEDEG